MEVILLEKIGNLGSLGDKVSVKAGFGRNYLIPGGKAVSATAANLEAFEARRAEFEAQATQSLDSANARKAQIEALESGVILEHKTGEEGKLFGSVGTADIADGCVALGIQIEKSEVRLPDGPLRFAGAYDIAVHLHADVDAVLKVFVVAES